MLRRLLSASLLAGVVLLGVLALPGRSAPTDPRATASTAAAAAYDDAATRRAQGAGTGEEVYRWSVRWMEAAAPTDPGAPAAHLARMQELPAGGRGAGRQRHSARRRRPRGR
ncbi:MAG: hypothetical protein R3F59_21255 [Myxococcota bacterium]